MYFCHLKTIRLNKEENKDFFNLVENFKLCTIVKIKGKKKKKRKKEIKKIRKNR